MTDFRSPSFSEDGLRKSVFGCVVGGCKVQRRKKKEEKRKKREERREKKEERKETDSFMAVPFLPDDIF